MGFLLSVFFQSAFPCMYIFYTADLKVYSCAFVPLNITLGETI